MTQSFRLRLGFGRDGTKEKTVVVLPGPAKARLRNLKSESKDALR